MTMTAPTAIARTESALAFSPRRVAAMMLRYWYLLRSSWPRLVELVYWPTVQMITWGFIQYYVMQNAGFFVRAGVSSSSMRPRFMMMTRSHSRSTSAMLCEASSTVARRSRQ